MKKAGFFVIPLFLLGLCANYSFADEIRTGNASAQSTVINNVQGNGSVTTHIETTANGQTNVIDSTGNGEIKVTNDNGNVTVSKTPQVTITETQTQTQISTATPTIKPPVIHKLSFVSNFFEHISNFLKRIFHNL